MTYIIALTGGIGSGKTVVSDHFASLGVPIIDTDVIARQVVQPGQLTLDKLVGTFGKGILHTNGELNRDALREIAFSNTENKAMLDSITHPAIRKKTMADIEQARYPYCIVVIPLLTPSSEFAKVMQRVLVVTASHEIKVKRVMKRSNLSEEEVKRIMATQLSEKDRLAFADDVIVNDGTIKDAHKEVEKLHSTYLELSATTNSQ